ncbi:MAG TPA: alanyl-tRNA editing protein [Candidatus Polarisedimenticolaceae bacterium]|nr:alanyl-tRNA editing protein [Candidatus Polarisedimenticolaceae bacterium]
MPDRKVFYEDPSRARQSTRVVQAGRDERGPFVRLEETIFYPEGGGQPADAGRIGEARVLDVQSSAAGVFHYVDREVAEGPVDTVLDVERRFDHCQQHTAQHLLTAVLLDRHGLATTSFHLGAATTSIEVKGSPPSREDLRRFEREINAHLREDRRVTARWVEPEELPSLPVRSRGLPEGHVGPVRLVEIEGLDLNTCGGTHVARLSEIQVVELIGSEPARGGTRITFLAGGRVLSAIETRRGIEDALRARIGTAPAEFASVLDVWSEERRRLDRRVRELEAEAAVAAAAGLAAQKGPILLAIRPGDGPEALRALAAEALKRRPEAVVLLVGGTGEAGSACFLVQAGPQGPSDVASIGGRVRDLLGAKGGGRGTLFQGKGGSIPDLAALTRTVEA